MKNETKKSKVTIRRENKVKKLEQAYKAFKETHKIKEG